MADWEPADKVQKSDTGEYRAMIGGEWVPVASAQKSDAGEYRVMRNSAPSLGQKPSIFKKQDVSEPNWIERQLAKLPSSWADANARGGKIGGFVQGAADPSVGAFQLAANTIGQGDAINKAIAGNEAEYQAARQASGRDGFDAMRSVGNIAVTAPIGGVAAVPSSTAGKLAIGAVTGAGFGASNPVTEGDFWTEKAKQAAAGAAGGALAVPVAAGVARLINPNAVSRVAELKDAGVSPTIGQALGGWANRMEEKAQSLPIMGDAIAAARGNARNQFNAATINKAVAPIGETVDDIGHAGVKAAGDKLSAAYDAALTKLGGVKFDSQFTNDFAQLRQMATGLTPNMANRFERIVNDSLIGKISPNGSMTAETLKQAESEIGKKAASFGSVGGEQGELGDALKQAVSLIRQQVGRASPDAAKAVRAADEGWANLVRVEGAAKAAKATEGVFTPGQLLGAVRGADQSVRDRATARGTALMQDWAGKGQSVLGNHYPDSGTAGRLMLGAGGLASSALSPAIPAALVGGAALYTSPIQKLLTSAVSNRPEAASKLAMLLRQSSPMLAPAGSSGAQAFINNR